MVTLGRGGVPYERGTPVVSYASMTRTFYADFSERVQRAGVQPIGSDTTAHAGMYLLIADVTV